MDTTGDGCTNFFMWLAVGVAVLMFFVLPVVLPLLAFLSNRDENNFLVLLVGLTIFIAVVAGYFELLEHKRIRIFLYGVFGIGILAFFRLIFLHIRDTFAKDARSGMAELLAIPVGVVVYGLVIWLLPTGVSEGKRKILLQWVKLLVFLIISGLVYLIYR